METTPQSILETIKQQITDNKLILYMKGTPEQPRCGFSARVVQILQECGVKFAYFNVLENSDFREGVKHYSNWPTFPQLYYQSELIGGCDIVEHLFDTGELKSKIS